MSAVTFDVEYAETRRRLTTFFRYLLIIPHHIVVALWGFVVQVVTFAQWFIVLFTGKRNEGIWDLQNAWLGYYARVYAYGNLLFDPYPPFGTDPGATGVTFSFERPTGANRLTNALRLIWAIPASIITAVLSFAAFFVVLVSWFAIVITGRQSRGMFDFILKVERYAIRTQAYSMLMTDTYPRYE